MPTPKQIVKVELDFMVALWDLDTGRLTVEFVSWNGDKHSGYSFIRHPVGCQSKFEYTRELSQVMESEWYKYAFDKR